MGRHCGLFHLRWGEAIDGDAPAYGKAAGARSETGLGVGPFLQLKRGRLVRDCFNHCARSRATGLNGIDAPSQGHPRHQPQGYDRT